MIEKELLEQIIITHNDSASSYETKELFFDGLYTSMGIGENPSIEEKTKYINKAIEISASIGGYVFPSNLDPKLRKMLEDNPQLMLNHLEETYICNLNREKSTPSLEDVEDYADTMAREGRHIRTLAEKDDTIN